MYTLVRFSCFDLARVMFQSNAVCTVDDSERELINTCVALARQTDCKESALRHGHSNVDILGYPVNIES